MVNRSVPALTLAAGLALAGAAFLLLHESFQPFQARFTLDGRDRSETFRLETREPLFLGTSWFFARRAVSGHLSPSP